MKLKAIYAELIKSYLDQKIDNRTWTCGEDSDNVYLIQHEKALWIIPKDCYPFDNERVFAKSRIQDPKRFIKTAYDWFKLELTPVSIQEGKQKLRLLKSEKFDTYVDNNYFKHLEPGTTFRAIDRRSPVFCFEEETLVAMIMPIVQKTRG